MKKVTIRDVAEEAGVSVATVSRVLNNKPDTSGATRRKVEAAVSKMGYTRSSQWVQITTGKSRTISLHFPNTGTDANPVHLAFISGAAAACEERDYRLHLVTQPMDKDDLLDLYRATKSDGIILMRVEENDWRVELLIQMDLPFVMIGQTADNRGASFIDYDLEAAVGLAMDHLVGLGHSHIGYLAVRPLGQRNHRPTVIAHRAYVDVCKRMNLPPLDFEVDQNLRAIQLVTTRIFSERPEVTALVTTREMVETAIYSAAVNSGLRIPADLSVVGLTTEQGTDWTSPSLTALDLPAWSMAHRAGNLLIDRLEEIETQTKEILWQPTLSVRDSTGPARRDR